MSKETGVITSVKYEAAGQNIELTLMDVKNYLVSGNASKVTNQEVGIFLKTCEGQKLNPFLREAYLVKYGDQPAQMIVGKNAFTKRAEGSPNYKGVKSGIIVVNLKKEIENREGTFIYTEGGEKLVGGWARVHFRDDKEEVFNTVSLSEYNTGKSLWAGKPATMIRKVALVQALRDAFPSGLGQLYIAEEIGIDDELPTEPIDPSEELKKANEVSEPPKMASKGLKQQVMQLAKEKELMTGEGKEANIDALEKLANDNGMSVRALTEDQANDLIKILMEYQVIQDVPEENIQTIEDETKVVDGEIVAEDSNEKVDDTDQF